MTAGVAAPVSPRSSRRSIRPRPRGSSPTRWSGNDTIVPVAASLASLAAAVAFRRALPSSTTQFAVLLSGTALAAALVSFLGEAIFGPSDLSYTGEPVAEPGAIAEVLLQALWWIGVAVGVRRGAGSANPGRWTTRPRSVAPG